jgi:hypothetical protein
MDDLVTDIAHFKERLTLKASLYVPRRRTWVAGRYYVAPNLGETRNEEQARELQDLKDRGFNIWWE